MYIARRDMMSHVTNDIYGRPCRIYPSFPPNKPRPRKTLLALLTFGRLSSLDSLLQSCLGLVETPWLDASLKELIKLGMRETMSGQWQSTNGGSPLTQLVPE